MLNGAGIFTHICEQNYPNVGTYTIHGAYGFIDHEISPSITVKGHNCTTRCLIAARMESSIIKGRD